jgi:hypothetical protein
MEWGDEEAMQESARRGPRQVRRLGPQRGQTAGQPRKWPQGRSGQKPQEDNYRATQCPTPTPGTPQERVSAAIASIRARFGYRTIGLGYGGIRYYALTLR